MEIQTISTCTTARTRNPLPTLQDGVSVFRFRRPSPIGFSMRLFLFDIDGTLVRVQTSVRTAITSAVEVVTGHTPSLAGIEYSGRTDPEIFQDILQANDLPATPEVLNQTLSVYERRAENAIGTDHVEVLPGAASLLSSLQEKRDVLLGLVTGNVRAVAHHKLRTAGLGTYFATGAFGNDHANRSHLPSLAILRASLQAGTPIQPSQTVIIGDTVNDIACARYSGSRSVAVSTGTPDRSELASSTPDLLLESLRSPNLIPRLLTL